MSTFKNKNSLRTIEAQIVQTLKNNEARPKFTGSSKKKACSLLPISALQKENAACSYRGAEPCYVVKKCKRGIARIFLCPTIFSVPL